MVRPMFRSWSAAAAMVVTRRPSAFSGGAPALVVARGLSTPPKKQKPRKGEEEVKDEEYLFYRDVIDAPKLKRPKFPPEIAAEHYRIGREYNRRMRICHDKQGANLQLKLDLQQFALKTLPPDLHEHAVTLKGIDGPPLDRRWWSWTPPIPGFDPSKYADPPVNL